MTLVALTGGTGLIGGHVAELFTARGIPVRAVARPGSDTSFLHSVGVEVVEGDILAPQSLERAFAGASFVIHTAALVSDWGPRRRFFEVNVRGTLHVLEAAKRASIASVVVTGSNSSYGEEHCESPKNEASPFAPRYAYFGERLLPSAMNHYRCSKAEATKLAMAHAETNGLDLTVIEPVFVFGEREFHSGFFTYLQEARRGTPFLPGAPSNLFHVVYARDLAQAYLRVFEQRPRGVNRFLIGNPTVDTMERVFSLFCSSAGLRMPRRMPKWTLYPVGLGLELVSTLLRREQPPVLTRARVNMFYDSICYDVSRAATALGFVASTPLEEAIRRTVEWYKLHDYL